MGFHPFRRGPGLRFGALVGQPNTPRHHQQPIVWWHRNIISSIEIMTTTRIINKKWDKDINIFNIFKLHLFEQLQLIISSWSETPRLLRHGPVTVERCSTVWVRLSHVWAENHIDMT